VWEGQIQPHEAMPGPVWDTLGLLDLARGTHGSHTTGMLMAAETPCSSRDDFSGQQPCSAAPAGSHRVPGEGSHEAKSLFSALANELVHRADGAKPLKLPPPEHPSSKAGC